MKSKVRNFEFETFGDEQFWTNVHLWEKESFDVIEQHVTKQTGFFDVGAWNGILSMYAAKFAKEVFAFEPDTTAFHKLIANVQNNGLTNIACLKSACSDNIEPANLFQSNPGDSVSSLINRGRNGLFPIARIEPTNCERLSVAINAMQHKYKKLFVKMDIEGGEVLVIPEIAEELKQFNIYLFVSFHPFWFTNGDYDTAKIANVLFDSHYCYNLHNEKLSRLEFEIALGNNELTYLFIPKGSEKQFKSNIEKWKKLQS